MEAVLKNVKRTMSYVNDDTKGLDKDVKRLQTELENTLTIHFVTANRLIYGDGKGHEYRRLREQFGRTPNRRTTTVRPGGGTADQFGTERVWSTVARRIENLSPFVLRTRAGRSFRR